MNASQRIPRFQLIELIGQGQFSNVYKARMIWQGEPTSSSPVQIVQPQITHTPEPTATQTQANQDSDQVLLLDFNAEPLIPPVVKQPDPLMGVFDQPAPLSAGQPVERFPQQSQQQQQQPQSQTQEEKFVALKRIKFYEIQNSKMRMDCIKEVKLLQQLKHPNIINYSVSFIQRNELFIVLELADGGDLSKLIRYFQKRKELLTEKIILKYFSQVCSAVRYIHSKRILHRDIKPANIFMTSEGCVKLGDFGLGRFFGQNTRDAHSYVGTFYYMSPERVRESGYDFSSDVWSLGCVLYELITLHSPFSIILNANIAQQPASQFNLQFIIDRICRAEYPSLSRYSNISAELRHLAADCLRLRPDERPDMNFVCSVVNEVHRLLQVRPTNV